MRWRLLLLAAIIAAGILSRVIHTGWIVFDKYLGDALYAAMVYVDSAGNHWCKSTSLPRIIRGLH